MVTLAGYHLGSEDMGHFQTIKGGHVQHIGYGKELSLQPYNEGKRLGKLRSP